MNSEFFSLRRFGRYFITDFKDGIDNFGLTLLFLSLGGLISYILIGLFSVIIGDGWCSVSYIARLFIEIIFQFVLIVMAGSKLYGHVTDRSRGASFASLPASTFEKTLSMLLITIVIVPCFYVVVYFGVDWILTSVDGSLGKSLAGMNFIDDLLKFAKGTETGHVTPFFWFLQLMFNMLIFLLGAIFFRRHKIAKTLLVIMGFSILSSVAISINGFDLSFLTVEEKSDLWPFAVFFHKVLTNMAIVEGLLIVAGAVTAYYRIKTIKY